MSSSQNREWSVSCGTAGSWSGALRGIERLHLRIQKFPEGDQILSGQDDSSAHDRRYIHRAVRKHLGRIWAYMCKRKSG